jgi:hypothetical protein
MIEAPVSNQFMLDRQAHFSVFHEKTGLVITGANSKHQPELATIQENAGGQERSMPVSSRLRMSDTGDRLALAFDAHFAELTIPAPRADRLPFRFTFIETAKNRLQDATLTLQLCLKPGEVLETAKSKITLGDSRIELGPQEIGGTIRHHGWVLSVDPNARLIWPVYPFNPYSNGPETNLSHAVGALSVPVRIKSGTDASFPWRRQEIAFELAVE